MPAPSKTTRTRAEINRANAQKSTGPRTPEGKAASSQNAFKHGLHSKLLVVPGENPAELDELRAAYRSEHQPSGITEETLVDELAQHFWRMRRLRNQETRIWQQCYDVAPNFAWIALIQRAIDSADRAFHRTLKALKQLQKDRGFVPNRTPTVREGQASAATATTASGFVPHIGTPTVREGQASTTIGTPTVREGQASTTAASDPSEISEDIINEFLAILDQPSPEFDSPGFVPELNA